MMRREPDFEESADMRLVELQRAALGVPKPDLGTWDSRIAAEGTFVAPEDAEPLQGAVVALDLSATPASGVIPGAVVTLALSIVNEGTSPARNVRVSVPLPGGAAYRNGSLARDGRSVIDEYAEQLFSDGLLLPEIPPKTRVTLVWKIGVRLGNKPLVIAPSARADESAIVGAQTLLISRKDGTAGDAGYSGNFAGRVQQLDRELPIYELDEEETLEHEAAQAALSPVRPAAPERAEYQMPMEPPTPATPPPSQPEPAAPDEPATPAAPEQPPDAEPVAAAASRHAIVLYGRIDRPSVAYFERLFNASKPPTLLNHFILGGALACTRGPGEGDAGALETHMAGQRQILQRIVLHEKLGKKEPIAQYAGAMLAHVEQLLPAPIAAVEPPDPSVIAFSTELDKPTQGVLAKFQDDAARWDFTKARQFTLALQARSISANSPYDRIGAAEGALRTYAQTSATQLQRFFVRMRLDRTTGLLFATDETLDAAARHLIAALSALF